MRTFEAGIKSFLSIILLLALCACAAREQGPATARVPSPTPVPPAQVTATPPPETRAKSEGSGRFNQYSFTYKRAGDEVEALFVSPKLPWNDSVVVAAAREVIIAAYDDRSENFPRPVPWTYKGAKANGIKLEGNNYEYVFVPVREDKAGEISSLIFWRLVKGTIKN